MNTNDIKKILNDLYTLDPSLRSHEKELVTIIRAMAIKPEAHYDPTFAAKLRAQLLTKLAMQNEQPTYLPWLRYAVPGIAVLLIAAGALTFAGLQSKNGGILAMNSSKVAITNVGANAFGLLGSLGAGNTAAAAPTAGAATAGTAGTAAMAPTAAGTSAIAMPIKPVGPIYPSGVKYDYTGSPISQNQNQLNVLKQVAQPISAGQATAALEAAGFGQVDLSSFSNADISTVTLSQNQSFGYQISLDLTDGTISINENYNEWPQAGATTKPLTTSDIPSNSAVIAIANQFLASHGIGTSAYGVPQVTNTMNFAVPVAESAGGASGNAGGSAAMPMIPYYSDSEQVLYPLVVNGMSVYDTGGNLVGMTVEVNVRYNRVTDVYGLETQSYQSSAYDAITDTSTILSMAENGQVSPIIYNMVNGGGTNIIVYDLGTPTMAYVEMYQTDSNGQSNEFLVPSFIFPVVVNANNTQARNIVVPLIKDFEQQNNVIMPSPPVPLNSGASGGKASPPTEY